MIRGTSSTTVDLLGCEALLQLILDTEGVSEVVLTRSIPGRPPHEVHRMAARRRPKRGRNRHLTFQRKVDFPSVRMIALIVEAIEADGVLGRITVPAEEVLSYLKATDARLTARAIAGFKAARAGFDSAESLLIDGQGRSMVTGGPVSRLAPFGLTADGEGRIVAIWEGARDRLEAAFCWDTSPEGAVCLIEDERGPIASCRALPVGGETGLSLFDTRVATLVHLKALAR